LCGGGGVVAAVTEDDFYDFAQGLFQSSSRFSTERNAGIGCACSKVVAANHAHFCGSIFCTPQEKTSVGGQFLECVRAFPPTFKKPAEGFRNGLKRFLIAKVFRTRIFAVHVNVLHTDLMWLKEDSH
jgi:hypothetical protein